MTPDALLEFLEEIGADPVTIEHPAQFHVGDNPQVERQPGAHTKNLFLKDTKGRFWLVSAEQSATIDLKALPKMIGSARLSFGSADAMQALLGVTPGSVTAFALVNDTSRRVRFVVDKVLWEADDVNFHPLVNTATIRVSQAGFRAFLQAVGVAPVVVDFTVRDCPCGG